MTPTKQTDRLTAETARVGMRVRCVAPYNEGGARVENGRVYTVDDVSPLSVRLKETGHYNWYMHRFIPADPQPDQSLRAILSERAPELLAALVQMHTYISGHVVWARTGRETRLEEAIERAGLLAEPSQPAPLPAMWCGADAFEGEG